MMDLTMAPEESLGHHHQRLRMQTDAIGVSAIVSCVVVFGLYSCHCCNMIPWVLFASVHLFLMKPNNPFTATA